MKYLHFTGWAKASTSLAVLVEISGNTTEWFPISQCRFHKDLYSEGDQVEVDVPEWLAIEKGIDHEAEFECD